MLAVLLETAAGLKDRHYCVLHLAASFWREEPPLQPPYSSVIRCEVAHANISTVRGTHRGVTTFGLMSSAQAEYQDGEIAKTVA